MINVHASLLPRYRGAAPVHRAVIDGMPETGVTIMRMVLGTRRGRHVCQGDATDRPDETSDIVERDLADLGASLLLDVIDDLAAGRAVEEPQDDSLSTYASKITKDEGPHRLDAGGHRHSQPGPRPLSMATRVQLPEWRTAHRDAQSRGTGADKRSPGHNRGRIVRRDSRRHRPSADDSPSTKSSRKDDGR